ncbi:MAG: hypothetical protein HPY54_08960 [Chthonomonadetes bacterium]|nr:hypothetical protein [Chthonomonadetes bacterium]
MRAILCYIALSAVALGAHALADDLSADARLQKAVSLQLHTALLDEVMQEINRQTGVAFHIHDSLKEEKATLFISDKPAWQVLNRLGEVLGIRYQKHEEAYHLVPDTALRQMEASLLRAEQSALRRSAEQMLKRWAQLAREDFTVITGRVRHLQAQMEKLQREKPPGWQERRAALAQQWDSLAQVAQLHTYLAGRVYRQTPPSVWARLWQGETLCFSYPQQPNTLPLPPDFLQWSAPSLGSQPVQLYLAIRLDLQRAQMVFTLLPLQEDVPPTPDNILQFTEEIPAATDTSQPLLTRWQKWRTPPDAFDQNPVLRRGRAPDGRLPTTRFGVPTVADWLQRIAGQGRLQVVADAFRMPSPLSTVGRAASGFADWFREFALSQPGYLRVEGDWLLFRHERYWCLRQSEPPESLAREMERKASEQGISLDDYAAFANALSTEAQTRLERGDYTARFDLAPLQAGIPALRFWASLSDGQKQIALRRQPVPYAQLTPAQQRLFREAIEAKLPADLLFLILPASDVAFLLERWSLPAYTAAAENLSITAESPEELEQQRHLLPPTARSEEAMSGQFTFYFGTDTLRSVQYALSIAKRIFENSF